MLLLGHRVERVVDRLGGRARRELDRRADRAAPRRRARGSRDGIVAEKSRFCRCARQRGEDPAQVGQEAHVEHVIGFVEHERLDAREPQRALTDQVEDPAGAADHDLGPPPQRRDLGAHRDAAEDRRGADPREAREQADLGVDLPRELARRGEDQRARARPGRGSSRRCEQRQREGGRLAGAGLGEAEHVAAVERRGDGLGLDRARRLEAGGADSAAQGAVEPEPVEAGRGWR